MTQQDPTQNFYEEYVKEYEEKTKDLPPKEWLEKFMSMLPQNGSVLDIGCAFGRDAKTFISHGFSVLGIDYSKAMIQRAKEYEPRAEFAVQDVLSLQVENESFDGIWACAVLLHIKRESIVDVLTSLHKALKPNGIVFLNLREGNTEGFIDDERYNNSKKFYSNVTKEEISNMLNAAGFTVEELQVRFSTSGYHPDTQGILELIARKA